MLLIHFNHIFVQYVLHPASKMFGMNNEYKSLQGPHKIQHCDLRSISY